MNFLESSKNGDASSPHTGSSNSPNDLYNSVSLSDSLSPIQEIEQSADWNIYPNLLESPTFSQEPNAYVSNPANQQTSAYHLNPSSHEMNGFFSDASNNSKSSIETNAPLNVGAENSPESEIYQQINPSGHDVKKETERVFGLYESPSDSTNSFMNVTSMPVFQQSDVGSQVYQQGQSGYHGRNLQPVKTRPSPTNPHVKVLEPNHIPYNYPHELVSTHVQRQNFLNSIFPQQQQQQRFPTQTAQQENDLLYSQMQSSQNVLPYQTWPSDRNLKLLPNQSQAHVTADDISRELGSSCNVTPRVALTSDSTPPDSPDSENRIRSTIFRTLRSKLSYASLTSAGKDGGRFLFPNLDFTPKEEDDYVEYLTSLPVKLVMKYLPCNVCSDRSSGVHYGIPACEGCKGFYRRSVDKYKNQDYARCQRNGNCSMRKDTRNQCQYCRFQKCIKAGMDPRRIKYGRMSKKRKQEMYRKIYHTLKNQAKQTAYETSEKTLVPFQNNQAQNIEETRVSSNRQYMGKQQAVHQHPARLLNAPYTVPQRPQSNFCASPDLPQYPTPSPALVQQNVSMHHMHPTQQNVQTQHGVQMQQSPTNHSNWMSSPEEQNSNNMYHQQQVSAFYNQAQNVPNQKEYPISSAPTTFNGFQLPQTQFTAHN